MASPEMEYLQNMAEVHSKFFAMMQLEMANLRAMLEVLLDAEKERLIANGISADEANSKIQQKVKDAFNYYVQSIETNR